MPSRQLTHLALSAVRKRAPHVVRDVNSIRMVLFSDHHRGRRDKADDFVQCEKTYLSALGFYDENNYELALLGDVDELWENPLTVSRDYYPDVLDMERKFYLEDRLFRIWGNHDDFWREPIVFDKYQGEWFKGLNITEGLRIMLNDEEKAVGEFLLVHGHQGSIGSDRFSTISRFFVRYLWRWFQNVANWKLTSPATNLRMRSKTDKLLYEWAQNKEDLAIIAGHTHQPVFTSRSHLDVLDELIKETHNKAEAKMAERIREDLEDEATRIETSGYRRPCYFNTGCCSFSDGDITGIEIIEGRILLVRWSEVTKKKTVLMEAPLSDLFNML